eukprot:3531824-Pleurochrysis_carterae.AAC.1
MSANDAARCMHRRLHAGASRIKALPSLVADAPASLAQSLPPSCSACAEANATRHPHSTERYAPTYLGRLIHVDIAGPFVESIDSARKYALVIVDDHTRYKAVHLLKHKHEAPGQVR